MELLTEQLEINANGKHLLLLLGWFCFWGLYIWLLIRSGESKLLLTLGFSVFICIEAYLILFPWNDLTDEQQRDTILAGWITPGFIVVMVIVTIWVHKRNGFKPEVKAITKDLEDFERDTLDVWR